MGNNCCFLNNENCFDDDRTLSYFNSNPICKFTILQIWIVILL
jgi:hypothetical protein